MSDDTCMSEDDSVKNKFRRCPLPLMVRMQIFVRTTVGFITSASVNFAVRTVLHADILKELFFQKNRINSDIVSKIIHMYDE